MVFDEITRLYNSLEREGMDGDMRKVFLSLNGGDPWTVSTKTNGTQIIPKTHLNYTGEQYMLCSDQDHLFGNGSAKNLYIPT